MLTDLSKPGPLEKPLPKPAGGTAAGVGHGSAAGIGDIFGSIKAGAHNLLNFLTYFQMKKRAGEVGAGGVNAVLRDIRAKAPGIKLHLVGHSFGGRLVTAAAYGPDNQPAISVDSITLLQAAFSHNGLAVNYDGKGHNGYFRRVLAEGRVKGPVMITHTVNDKAVGMAYPLASRIGGQQASGLGDAADPFGGMGRNGAQHTPEKINITLLAPSTAYSLQKGKVYNLLADEFIKGHSDITNPATAHAFLSAVGKT